MKGYECKFHLIMIVAVFSLIGCSPAQDEQSGEVQLSQENVENVRAQQVKETKEDLYPNRNNIKNKVHIKKIQELKKDHGAVDNYVEQLSTKEILETAVEMSEEGGTSIEDNGIILIPHLKKRWANSVPVQEIDKQLKDKTMNKKYRMFLIDLGSSLNQATQDVQMIDSLISIGQDVTEDSELRRFALLKIRNTENKKAMEDGAFLQIVKDSSTPPEVRGAAITALKKTKSPNFKAVVEEVVTNPDIYPGIMVRHALADGAKSGQLKDIQKMRNIAERTQDGEVYATAVYSLGIEGTPEAMQAIIDVYGRYGNTDIGDYALQVNEKTIVDMLSVNATKSSILYGLKAAGLINSRLAVESIQRIIQTSTDQEIVNLAYETLNKIRSAPIPQNPVNKE